MVEKISYGSWVLPQEVWEHLEPLLPKYRRSAHGGQPRLPVRTVAEGIYYVLRTGCQWKAAPKQYGSGSSLHRYFQEWRERGIFRKLWKQGVLEYDKRKGIQWEWQSLDGAMTKAPLGGGKNGSKPHGSGQIRNQAVGAHRWRGGPAGHCGRGCQHARQAAG